MFRYVWMAEGRDLCALYDIAMQIYTPLFNQNCPMGLTHIHTFNKNPAKRLKLTGLCLHGLYGHQTADWIRLVNLKMDLWQVESLFENGSWLLYQIHAFSQPKLSHCWRSQRETRSWEGRNLCIRNRLKFQKTAEEDISAKYFRFREMRPEPQQDLVWL